MIWRDWAWLRYEDLMDPQVLLAATICIVSTFLSWQSMWGQIRRTALLAGAPALTLFAAIIVGSPVSYLWCVTLSKPHSADLLAGAVYTAGAFIISILNLRQRDRWHHRVGIVCSGIVAGAMVLCVIRFVLFPVDDWPGIIVGEIGAMLTFALILWVGCPRRDALMACPNCGYDLRGQGFRERCPECGLVPEDRHRSRW